MKKKLCMLLIGLCLVSMPACGNKMGSDNSDNAIAADDEIDMNEDVKTELKSEPDNSDFEIKSESQPEQIANAEKLEENTLVDGMRPEFKEAMDSYEAFYDEYCDFMKKYSENPSDMKLLASYMDMLTKVAEMSEKFEAWENNEMNDTEMKYYLDVNNRVMKKLLEVSE